MLAPVLYHRGFDFDLLLILLKSKATRRPEPISNRYGRVKWQL